MKNISIAVAAISTIVVAQPSFASGHRNALHTQSNHSNGILRLGELYAVCCGGVGNDASAQILHNNQGFGAQLQVTQPSCCESTYVETGIENIYGTRLNKAITFTVSGANGAAPPVSNFGVDVAWVPPGGSIQFGFFTVANGGLVQTGTYQFALVAGGHGITPGSTLLEVDFELDGNCVSGKQTAFVQNVFVDKSPVNYDMDSISAFCGGCS